MNNNNNHTNKMTKQHEEEDMKNYVLKSERANLKDSNKV